MNKVTFVAFKEEMKCGGFETPDLRYSANYLGDAYVVYQRGVHTVWITVYATGSLRKVYDYLRKHN